MIIQRPPRRTNQDFEADFLMNIPSGHHHSTAALIRKQAFDGLSQLIEQKKKKFQTVEPNQLASQFFNSPRKGDTEDIDFDENDDFSQIFTEQKPQWKQAALNKLEELVFARRKNIREISELRPAKLEVRLY